jgi:6-phosphogluconolactonase
MPKLTPVTFTTLSFCVLSFCMGCGSKQLACSEFNLSTCPTQTQAAYVYAAGNNGQIAAFPINESSDALGTPITAAGPAASVGIAEFGNQFLYASNPQAQGGASIDAWSIDDATGALSTVKGSPFLLGPSAAPNGLALADNVGSEPNGPGVFLYVADTGKIDALQVNTSSGALTTVPGSPFASGTNEYLTVDPTDHFVFAADEDPPGGVFAFTINASTGALTPAPGSPFLIGSNSNPVSVGQIVVSQVESYVYVTLPATGQVAGFSIASSGVLTPIPGSPFAAGSGAFAIAINNAPGSNGVYVANQTSGSISGYTIDAATGALSTMVSSPYAAAGVTVLVTDAFYHLYAYGASGITIFSIDLSSDTLTPIGSPVSFSGATVLTYVGPNGTLP